MRAPHQNLDRQPAQLAEGRVEQLQPPRLIEQPQPQRKLGECVAHRIAEIAQRCLGPHRRIHRHRRVKPRAADSLGHHLVPMPPHFDPAGHVRHRIAKHARCRVARRYPPRRIDRPDRHRQRVEIQRPDRRTPSGKGKGDQSQPDPDRSGHL